MRININEARECLSALRIKILAGTSSGMTMDDIKETINVYKRLEYRIKTYSKQISNN